MIVYSVMISNHRRKWKFANIMFRTKVTVKKMSNVLSYMENFRVNSIIPVRIVRKVNDVNSLMMISSTKTFVLHSSA